MTDQRAPRDGRFIEMIGHYNPQTNPSEIVLDRDRLDHWIAHGAQPTNTVKKLMRAHTETAAAAPAEAGEDTEVPAEAEPVAEGAEPTGS